MKGRKAERLLNLTIALLSARGYLTKHDIRERVAGYAGLSDGAFERSFERDKDELRNSGITISVGQNAEWGGEEAGYRILRSEFELPAIDLTPEEAAVVGVSTRAWSQADLAASTVTAAHKLALKVGQEATAAPWDPNVTVPEAVFGPFMDAVSTHTVVRFDYRNSRGETTQRIVEPWGLSQTRGAWYVTGRDRTVGERRTFKLDRVIGKPRLTGGTHAFELPADFDMREITRSLAEQPASHAVIALRPGAEAALQRRVRPTDYPVPVGVDADWIVGEIPYTYRPGFIGELAAAAGNLIILDPPELREEVVRRWQGVLGS